MQPQPKSDLLYLIRILEYSYKLISYSSPFHTAEEFFLANEQMPFNASLTLVAQIGEDSNKISGELKRNYNHIDWPKIYSLRNRIIHDYAGLDKYITFKIVKDEVPQLIEQIISVIEAEVKTGNFDGDEFNLTKKSGYYKYIDFTRFNI